MTTSQVNYLIKKYNLYVRLKRVESNTCVSCTKSNSIDTCLNELNTTENKK